MPTPEKVYVADATKIRRRALYAFLLDREGWISMFDLAYHMKDLYPGYGWVSNFHNSHIRRMITADIEAINEDPDFPMIIISSKRGVKIADRDEFERWIRSEYAEIFKKLKRVLKIAKKAGLDGQVFIDGEVVGVFRGEKDG